jgi:hypothetical protein
MIEDLKPLIGKLAIFAKNKMGFDKPPRLFLKNDSKNSERTLGKTAYYNPAERSVTLFVHNRHPKDVLRSFAHELVHHTQNLRGDLSPEKIGDMSQNYAQDNDHMRNMEKEAYLQGNMCFRDWEDGLEDKDTYTIKLAESKFLKENKTMTTKITKKFLEETIRKILKEGLGLGQTASNSEEELQAAKSYVKLAKKLNPGVTPESDSDFAEAMKTIQAAMPKPKVSKLKRGIAASLTIDEEDSNKESQEETEEEDDDIEEGMNMVNHPKTGKKVPPFVVDGKGENDEANESKIQTPEQEESLYENRFGGKNERLYEKLIKEWTK